MINKANQQKGYGGIEAFVIGIVAAIIMLMYFYPKFTHKQFLDSASCYIKPEDATEFLTSAGSEYALIKEHAPTIKVEMPIHFEKVEDVTIDGKTYPLYKARENEILATPSTEGGGIYRPLQSDISALRFVDRSIDSDPTYTLTTPGLADLAVYLEKEKPVPDFIKQYCEAGFPVSPLTLLEDTQGKSLPPLEMDSGNISWQGTPPRSNITYRLFAYDKKGSFSFAVGTSQRLTSKAQYTFTSAEKTVTYNAYFLYNSPPETITLVNADPNAADATTGYRYTPKENVPLITPPPDLHVTSAIQKDMLQLEAFLPLQVPPWGWWTPECKPAVYLYPDKEMVVNVKVSINNGFLTYTDPLYPANQGWNVLALPTGDLHYLGKNLASSKGVINYPTGVFPYLYYEGKIKDETITKPTTGFVKPYDQLSNFFNEILPKLGLNTKESSEFKSYWLNALPKSPYYFIGIIPQEQLNQNEPLTITPQQDTMIRVRLYFQQLDQPISIKPPVMQTPQRSGFTVVDWGGLFKADKQHPFTCVQ